MVELKRTKDVIEYINNCRLKYADNEKYKYLHITEYIYKDDVPNDWGWHKDYFGIYANEKLVGYITLDLSHVTKKINNICVFIDEEYLGMGYGTVALLKLVHYYLKERGFNKAVFLVISENKMALKMYRKMTTIAGREVGYYKNHTTLRDGKFYDMVIFEIMQTDLTDDVCDTIYQRYLS